MIKIIAGRLKGRIIPTIKGADYRPSTGKLREAIFSILNSKKYSCYKLHNARILDLFSGTGCIALEAISRGAAYATLVDINYKYLNFIKEYSEKIGEVNKMTFLKCDAFDLPIAACTHDIIFIDPPYNKTSLDSILISLDQKYWLKNDSVILVESFKNTLIEIPSRFNLIEDRIYGNTKLTILNYVQN